MFPWMKDQTEEVEPKLAEINLIKQQIKDLQERETELWDEVVDAVGEGSHSVGDFIVKIHPQYRFDAALAKKVLTQSQLSLISVAKPDSTLAKKFLDEELYEKVRKRQPNPRKTLEIRDV